MQIIKRENWRTDREHQSSVNSPVTSLHAQRTPDPVMSINEKPTYDSGQVHSNTTAATKNEEWFRSRSTPTSTIFTRITPPIDLRRRQNQSSSSRRTWHEPSNQFSSSTDQNSGTQTDHSFRIKSVILNWTIFQSAMFNWHSNRLSIRAKFKVSTETNCYRQQPNSKVPDVQS